MAAYPSSTPRRPLGQVIDDNEGDERTGASIVAKALEQPMRRIAENAGQEGSVVVDMVKKLDPSNGYDASHDDYGNMVEKGIIDPLKVTRAGLENAVSVAAMVLTTESLVTEIPDKSPPMPPAPPMDY